MSAIILAADALARLTVLCFCREVYLYISWLWFGKYSFTIHPCEEYS